MITTTLQATGGTKGFGVKCSNGNPMLTVVDHDYWIRSINYSHQTLTVADRKPVEQMATSVFQEEFQLRWTSQCTHCESSGGYCGRKTYSVDYSDFHCFCPNGTTGNYTVHYGFCDDDTGYYSDYGYTDFGLAKLCLTREDVVSMLNARGTIGYIAPEVYQRDLGSVSSKSDVYSYGMMLLEMVGGRKNIDVTADNTSEIYFPHWIYNHLEHQEENRLEGLKDKFNEESVKNMIMVGLWCIQMHPPSRPSMSMVVEMLQKSVDELSMPPNPFLDPRTSSTGPT